MVNKTKQTEILVKAFITSEKLIPKNALVLAAVSGGQDSMAMLHILHILSHELGFKLAVGHFDHKLRDESQKDKELAERFARDLALPFHAGAEDVRARVSKTGDTLEEGARKARYDWLYRTADMIGAGQIATGHTRDDQVETVLMRILWGSGIRGLAGIPVKRGMLVRPIIHISREETLDYCAKCGIAFVSDPSNTDKRFMRNKIRLELLPLLKESFHPGIEQNLLHLCSNAKILLASIRKTTAPVLEQALREHSSGEWILDMTLPRCLDDTSLFVLFSDIFADHLGCDMDFTQRHYRDLFNLCKAPQSSGKSISLPGLTVKREFGELIFRKTPSRLDRPNPHRIDLSSLKLLNMGIKVPGKTTAPGISVTAEVQHGHTLPAMDLSSSATIAYFSLDKITPPLTLRTPASGDRMCPFGMTGSKKLSDIFIDKKIPWRQRAKTLVLSDVEEIMWLVGVTTSESFRITEATKSILKVTVNRE